MNNIKIEEDVAVKIEDTKIKCETNEKNKEISQKQKKPRAPRTPKTPKPNTNNNTNTDSKPKRTPKPKTQKNNKNNNNNDKNEENNNNIIMNGEPEVKVKKERICPEYKRLENTNIVVDAFTYQSKDHSAYFLSHYHSDHYIGLRKTFKGAPICI